MVGALVPLDFAGAWRVDALLMRMLWRVTPRTRVRAGICALLLSAWVGIYGQLWSFERLDAHRFTSKAMLAGALRLRNALTHIQNDEQVYNGAAYTNWGFGVPLLQIPFHASATAMGFLHGFFPDRAIYFLYAAAMIPILWAAFDRLLAMRASHDSPRGERIALSLAATWLVLTSALFPLTSTRFIIYEETVAYFLVFELLAISAYIFTLQSRSLGPVFAIGMASGMGLLIRPTGALYCAAWSLIVTLEYRTRRTVAFLASLVPFAAFWLYGNWVRTGSPFELGYSNTTPAWHYDMPVERFGSQCPNTPRHALEALARLLTGFFIFVSHEPSSAWLKKCHFDFEERAGVLPFFGPWVLAVVGWMFYRLLARRERQLALYVPYAAMVVLFAGFVRRGQGFAWRYAADFWPAIAIACVQYVRTLPAALTRSLQMRLAKVMFWYGLAVYLTFLLPWLWSPVPEIVPATDASAMLAMSERFQDSRRVTDERLPSRISCGDALATIFQNGLGWKDGCTVDTFTNVLLGVTAKEKPNYRIRATTNGMTASTVRIYVNGTIYTAHKVGDSYEADVFINYAALVSPVVVATVLWTRDLDRPPGKLLSIELV